MRTDANTPERQANVAQVENLRPMRDSARLAAVMDAAAALHMKDLPLWADVAALSHQTEPDGVETAPEGIFQSGDMGFVAVATGYIILNFKTGSRDVQFSDNFPMTIKGHFKADGTVAIDDVTGDMVRFAA